MVDRRFRALLPLFVLFSVAACGGGGGGGGGGNAGGGGNPPPPLPPPPTSINLSSDAGDYIGAGDSYSYTQADALITVDVNDGLLSIDVNGDERWSGRFQLPNTFSQLEVGVYTNLTRYGFHDPAIGGVSWSGEGRVCIVLTGTITIDEVEYDGANLVYIDLSFEQHCEGAAPALRGNVIWNANDATSPPGPAIPPAGLWEPAAGATPDAGSYVYLESEPGDHIGQGLNYLYTPVDAVISVSDSYNGISGSGGRLDVSVEGNEQWDGDFDVMSSISFLEVGYYGDLQQHPSHNPAKGGLEWQGEGRACAVATGWFVVDSVTYSGNTLEAIALRFAQDCRGDGTMLYGEIHWSQ
jgi:hypothetical protein